MITDIKHRIEQLSDQDRKLLLYKLKDMVSDATVSNNSDKPKRLVAYIKPNDRFDLSQFNDTLKKQLPNYMVPSTIHTVEEIPLLPNGKIDRKGLKHIIQDKTEKVATPSKGANASNSEVEEQLTKVWEEVLDITPIYKDDNFFEIGGDSILSIQIISKARKLGIELTANQLFEHQTIAEISQYLQSEASVEEEEEESGDFLVPLRKEGTKNPLFCIHSGGGHVFFYNLLSKYIKSDRPIYALEPHGLYGGEHMHDSIETMSKDYMKAIQSVQKDGVYNILVYCFSVTVGNEMAIEFAKLGHKTNIIVVDTMASPWNLNRPDRITARMKAFTVRFLKNPFNSIKLFFVDRLWHIKPLLVKYFGNDDTRDLENLQENLRKICLAYEFKPHQGNISLILTKKPHKALQNIVINSWKELTKEDGLRLFYTKGNHRTVFEEPDISYVSQHIEASIVD